KYGYVLSLEQALTDDIGLFGRWSWNNGKTEIMAFTDIDASLSLGTSIKGTKWGRPDDVIGIGGAINALSRDHRDFIAAGGLGVLIGDGQLNYRKERILETYYAYALTKQDRKSTRLNSSHVKISYAVFCLKKKKPKKTS